MMKNVFGFSLLLVLLVIGACKSKTETNPKENTVVATTEQVGTADASGSQGLKIAYFNEDSLMANFKVFDKKKIALTEKQANIERSANTKIQSLQKEYSDLEARAQKGDIPPAKIQEEGMKLEEKREKLLRDQERQTTALQDELVALNEELRVKTLEAIEELKKTETYDFIFLHGTVSAIMDANPKYDITTKLVDILNTKNTEEAK